MPRITEEERDSRRVQIMDAARSCVAERGLEAVSMEMIIERSKLSTGSVYRYFKGKDDVIAAAVLHGTSGFMAALQPVLDQDPPPPLPELVKQLLRKQAWFNRRGDTDLRQVALHGWSHAQSHPDLKVQVEALYQRLRQQLAHVCKHWQSSGQLRPDIDPNAVAQLLLSIVLGFTAQRALTGKADINAHTEALARLLALE